jgi:hypothetical protein
VWRKNLSSLKIKKNKKMSIRKNKKRGRKETIRTMDYVVKSIGVDMESPVQDTRRNELEKFDVADRKACLAKNLGITSLTPNGLFAMAKIKKGN